MRGGSSIFEPSTGPKVLFVPRRPVPKGLGENAFFARLRPVGAINKVSQLLEEGTLSESSIYAYKHISIYIYIYLCTNVQKIIDMCIYIYIYILHVHKDTQMFLRMLEMGFSCLGLV